MERRLFTFMLASTMFLVVYSGLRILFNVQPPQPVQVAEQEAEKADPELAEEPGEETKEQVAGAADPLNGDEPSAENADLDSASVSSNPDEQADPEADADSTEVTADPRQDVPQKWMTMGSMDKNSAYLMLVTVTNRGSGIERIELTERDSHGKFKYRRVDVRSGYLGYFAGQPAPKMDGVLVNVVGPGTPAAQAVAEGGLTGIQPGDVILAVDGTVVVSSADIERALSKSKPGDEVIVEVRRPNSNPGAAPAADQANGAPASNERLNFRATLTEHPLDLVRLASVGGTEQVEGNLDRLSCLMTLEKINRKSIPVGKSNIAGAPNPRNVNWLLSDQQNDAGDVESLTFRLPLANDEMEPVGGEAVELFRTYTLRPGQYHLDMGVKLFNRGKQAQDLAYRLEGLNGLTLEGWWYINKISPNWGGAAARDVIYKSKSEGHDLVGGTALLKQARNEPQSPGQTIFAPDSEPGARQMSYIGVDAQYFAVAYLSPDLAPIKGIRRATANVIADTSAVPKHKERAVNTSFYLDSEVATLEPGQSLQQDLRIFAGPKRPELLETYALGDSVYYGWFSWPAKILSYVLHVLHGLVGNYALAIVLLTVLVRGLMFPFSRKAAVNAQKMQELAPELKKIAEQYKDDMEGRLKAQRELQQRVGFNPLAGCAPMLLQMPIFIGLYRSLSVDIELRQASLSSATSWASNLAGPDMLAYWGGWLWEYLSGRGTGWLGPYFNVLPVLVMGLFLAQQKMFMPPATDEQTAMTQKVMTYMTLMMGIFFFRVPAGLCVYLVTSSLWGICERLIVKRTLPEGKHFDQAVLEGTASKPTSTSAKLADRLRQQIAPDEPPVERPNKRKRPATSKKKR